MVLEGLIKDHDMYGKIFHSIYDGTLAEDWRALITFQQLIVLCDADGIIDMTPQSIARRTGIPIEHIEAGLSILTEPDPQSRSDKEDGKRILPIDDRGWGWQIVNHKFYRDLRTADDRREYMRNYMRNKRKEESKQKLTKANNNKQLTQLAYTDTDTDTDTIKTSTSSPNGDNPVPFQKIVDLYHEKLPELPKCEILNAKRKGYIRQRWQDKEHGLHTLTHWENFFTHIRKSDFLMGKSQSNNGRPPFRANLEWITNLSNYTKIYEDKYHGQ